MKDLVPSKQKICLFRLTYLEKKKNIIDEVSASIILDTYLRRVEKMDKTTGKFTITNNEGKEIECDILFTFDNNETKSYIIFTDNTLDENNNIKVYANTYDPEGKISRFRTN